MKRCAPFEHIGPIVLRRLSAREVRKQCDACLEGIGKKLPVHLFEAKPELWRRKKQSAKSRNSRRRRYEAYLRSPQWEARRKAILIRDNFTCRACGNPANSVHHVVYRKMLDDVPDEELIAACGDCQTKEREMRVSGLRKVLENR